MAYDTPVLDATGGDSSFSSVVTDTISPDASTEADVVDASKPNPIYIRSFNVWAGYVNQTAGYAGKHDASTGKRYSRSFSTWRTPSAAFKTLVWVGMGGLDAETGSFANCDHRNLFGPPYNDCIIQAGTDSSDPKNTLDVNGNPLPTEFWTENYPAEGLQRFKTPAVSAGDSVSINVRYGPLTHTAVYTFINNTTHRSTIVTKRQIVDPSTNSAECVVEQGFDNPYGRYDQVTYSGCGVRWYNPSKVTQGGIANMGSSGDPGPVTNLYGSVGYALNSLVPATGSFHISCSARSKTLVGPHGGALCIAG